MKQRYQFICIDDDSKFLDLLVKNIKQYFHEKINFQIDTYTSLISIEKLEKADALFLNITVDHHNSLSVIEKIEKRGKYIPLVFISQYDHDIYYAQNYNMIYFIRKSHFYDGFDIAMNKLYHKLLTSTQEYITLSKNHQKIDVQNIIYVETYSHHYVIHTLIHNYSCCKNDIDYLLDKYSFLIKIHRSYVFNINYITLIDENYVYLHEIYKIKLGKQKRNTLKKIIKNKA